MVLTARPHGRDRLKFEAVSLLWGPNHRAGRLLFRIDVLRDLRYAK